MERDREDQKGDKTPDLFSSEIMNDNEEQGSQNTVQNQKAAITNSLKFRGITDTPTEETIDCILMRNIPSTQQVIEKQKENIRHKGILLKQSPGFFGGWQRRYCQLNNNCFVYRQNEAETSAKAGILNFNLLSCQLTTDSFNGQVYYNIKINVANCEKKFVFKGETLSETHLWGGMIDKSIRNSEGWKKNYSYLAKYPRFWRVRRISKQKNYQSDAQFRKNAQSGDIVLFRGSKSSSIMQRAITMDEYGIFPASLDHIGVVLLNQIGEILIFQANGGFGVGICPWNKFVGKQWFQQQQLQHILKYRIVHRPLEIYRGDNKLVQNIQQFVRKNIGKKYNFSLKQYLFKRTSTGSEQSQFYCCSSLVAKLYKYLELLDPNKSSTQYLPSSFSQKQHLQLRTDGKFGFADLSQQKIIVFQH